MIDINEIIDNKFKNYQKKHPYLSRFLVVPFLRFCFCEKKFYNARNLELAKMEGIEFVSAVLKHFNFKVRVKNKSLENIPKKGRVIIIANHPIGSLDGLALLETIHKTRPDVKIIANEWLSIIPNIKNLLHLVNNIEGNTLREYIQSIYKHLQEDKALIVFPAGEVSRWGLKGIRDNDWNPGFLRFAAATKSPILPIHLKARNSYWFYFLSLVNTTLSSLWLVREMMKQKNKKIRLTIGELIPFPNYHSTQTSLKLNASLMKRHLYRVPNKWLSKIFKTESTIIPAQNTTLVKAELTQAVILDKVDNQITYQYSCSTPSKSILMQELGRAREIAFRAIGEGSGSNCDLDKYDSYFYHLILWDEKDEKIAGSYRLGHGEEIVKKNDISYFYSNHFYKFSDEIIPYLRQGVELGRSFISPQYWKRGGLKKLFLGIDAWMKNNPDRRYLFGTISISNNYPPLAKDMIVYFYQHYFGAKNPHWVQARLIPYFPDSNNIAICKNLFTGEYKDDLTILKEQLNSLGVTIPTLFRQYSELCQKGAIEFYSFNIDAEFNYSLDSFIIVDTHFLNPAKSKFYFPYLCSKIEEKEIG